MNFLNFAFQKAIWFLEKIFQNIVILKNLFVYLASQTNYQNTKDSLLGIIYAFVGSFVPANHVGFAGKKHL